MDSPLRMMLTPHKRFAKSTPTYGEPVGVITVSSVNGRNPKPASTTCRSMLLTNAVLLGIAGFAMHAWVLWHPLLDVHVEETLSMGMQ